jgi:2-polyprenyl-3-methyl-5-hydroxy-6-metoxy-1,4-benzoquinol methylase
MNSGMQEKTSTEFWDKNWQEISFGKYSGMEKYLAINRKLNGFFKRNLSKGEKKVLEIGCAGGKRLIFFARDLGHSVYGVDYSEKGAALARENLKAAGVKGEILCEDIFNTSLPAESFDVVYSLGLIEHFDEPGRIIEAHLRLLKAGGMLIFTIPNFNKSLTYFLNRLAGKAKELKSTHNLAIMDKAVLKKILEDRGVQKIKVDYFGPADFSTVFSTCRFPPAVYLSHMVNQTFGYLTYFLPASRLLSPYLVAVGVKAGKGIDERAL